MKKLICGFIALIIAASFCINSMAAFTYGDVNADKKINSSDALQVLMHSTKLTSLTGDKKRAADVNGDGAINSSDALLILSYSVGLIKHFPAESNSGSGPEHEVFG